MDLNASSVVAAGQNTVHSFTYYDYGVVLCMLISSGLLGLYCAFVDGPQKSTRQLLTADGNLPPVLVSTSLMASFISAAYILGNVTEIYLHGAIYFFTVGCYCLVIPVTAHLYVPVFYKSGALTCYEYLEFRFNRLIRHIALGCYIIQMLMYLGIQLYAPALAISRATGIELWPSVLAIGLVCTLYTSLGGIKAVVYTDSFQAVVMIVAMVIVVILGFRAVGGFAAAWEIARAGGRLNFNEFSVDLKIRHTIWGLIIGLFTSNLASYATNQMMVLRYLTVSPLSSAKWVVWGNLPYLVLIFMLSCLCGLITFSYFHLCDPVENENIDNYEQLLPYFIMRELGSTTGIPGVFVAGIFAASLSSISSGVNALANVIYVDIIILIWPNLSNKIGSYIINLLGAICGLLAIGLVAAAQLMGNAQAATSAVNSGLGGPLLSLFTLGMFVPFVNSKGALIGFAASLAVSLWLNVTTFLHEPPIIPPPPPLSTVGCGGGFPNKTTVDISSTTTGNSYEDFNIADQVSYVWYTSISLAVGFLITIPVSLLTGAENPRKMNPDLIGRPFDWICPWLSSDTRDWLAFHVGEEYVNRDAEENKNVGHLNASYDHSIQDLRERRRSLQAIERR